MRTYCHQHLNFFRHLYLPILKSPNGYLTSSLTCSLKHCGCVKHFQSLAVDRRERSEDDSTPRTLGILQGLDPCSMRPPPTIRFVRTPFQVVAKLAAQVILACRTSGRGSQFQFHIVSHLGCASKVMSSQGRSHGQARSFDIEDESKADRRLYISLRAQPRTLAPIREGAAPRPVLRLSLVSVTRFQPNAGAR